MLKHFRKFCAANYLSLTVEMQYKLYYGGNGAIITYTTEKLGGQYIEITKEQYAEARMDIKVINGKIVNPNNVKILRVLAKNSDSGVKASKYDVNILSETDYFYWKIVEHEATR